MDSPGEPPALSCVSLELQESEPPDHRFWSSDHPCPSLCLESVDIEVLFNAIFCAPLVVCNEYVSK